jgi:hypothetical protein
VRPLLPEPAGQQSRRQGHHPLHERIPAEGAHQAAGIRILGADPAPEALDSLDDLVKEFDIRECLRVAQEALAAV